MTVQEFAKKFKVSERTLRHMCENGKIPAVKHPASSRWQIDMLALAKLREKYRAYVDFSDGENTEGIYDVMGYEFGFSVRERP